MFTMKEKGMLTDGYFAVIREDEKFIEVKSQNTGHYWMIYKKEIHSGKPIILYHKHAAGVKYYHKQREILSVSKAVESIKSHDKYVLSHNEIFNRL